MTGPRLVDTVAHYATTRPDHEAVIDGELRLSYRALLRLAQRTSRRLQALGLRPGARVAHLGRPGAPFLVSCLGTHLAGGVWAGLEPRATGPELVRALEDLQPAVLLVEAGLGSDLVDRARAATNAAAPSPGVVVIGSAADLADLADLAGEALRPPDLMPPAGTAVVVYTSGTTGVPRGACLTHAGIVEAGRLYAQRYAHPDPRVLLNLPINHVGSLVDLAASTLTMGGTIVTTSVFDPAEALDILRRERLTLLGQVPTMHLALAAAGMHDPDAFPDLMHVVWSGAAMPRDWIEARHGGRVQLSTCYGLTECTGAVTFTRPEASVDELATTVGRPPHDGLLRIGSAQGDASATDAPADSTGEVELHGPLLAAGYLRRPEASRELVRPDGWLRTGDLGRLLPDGSLVLVGRSKEMYKSGGYNVYPREVELVLEQHPAVIAAAVVAAPDPLWQESGHAYVTTRGPITTDELLALCRTRLAGYKLPRRVTLLPQMPLLANGKVDKAALHQAARDTEQVPT